jgi:predicted ATPase/class 3 adenylate cyclase
MQSIAHWLNTVGLGQYAERFAESYIDADVLRDLTDGDLEKIGIPLGHRKKLLRAIRELADASAATPPQAATSKPAPHDSAERRQLTVMFVDLVGSTGLSTMLDPEDLQEIIGAYHRCCAKVITQSGGFVARYLGDGVLAYFGYPQAHEDDAEQAVRAGLGLVEGVAKLEAGQTSSLRVRVGIATGLVVVGDLIGGDAAHENEVVGETPNLAARLQALAEPDAVVIESGTRRLLGGLFDYSDLGAVPVKGFGGSVQVWRVLGASSVASRFEALRTMRTPLVGREEEIDLLMRRWQQAKGGEGPVVLISGEPGIGKSRIAQTVLERLSGEPHTPLRLFCSPHHQDSALYPTITQLERAAGFRRDDTDPQRLDKLEALLGEATSDFSEAAPLIADLLSVPTGDRYPPLNLTPQKRKEKTLRALLAQLEGLASHGPVLMVFEDVQWIDPTSLELLDLTVDRVATLPVLLIVTFRPEFTAAWIGRPQVTLVTLNRLPPRERAQMISGITAGKALPKEVLDQIIERTDGVPLFIEELTKAVVESGVLTKTSHGYTITGPVTPLAIPTSLHASLLARLDRLAPVREVAQIAAVLGRSFSHELVSAVSVMPKQQLENALEQLTAAELIFRRGTPPDADYTFKHALVQDAAYSTLLRARRQQLHACIAVTLERQFRDIVEAQPELLARHYAKAGLIVEAIKFYLAAASRATSVSNGTEAISHLTKGLALVKMLPVPDQRSCELRLQIALGASISGLKGYGAPEVEATYARARELCAGLGDSAELFHALAGLRAYHLVRARLDLASDFCRQMSELASRLDNPKLALSVHHVHTVDSFFTGNLSKTLLHCDRVLALCDTKQQPKRGSMVSDAAIESISYCAQALWALGYTDKSDEKAAAAIALANSTGNLFSLCIATHFQLYLYLKKGQLQLTAEAIETLSSVAIEHGFDFWSMHARIWKHWHRLCVTKKGSLDDIDRLRDALASLRVQSSALVHPFFSTLLVRCLAIRGRITEAVDLLNEALDEVVRVGSTVWEPEFRCLMGDLLCRYQTTPSEQGERSYHLAIRVAQGQNAKMWELHAALGLARLWRDQGKRTEAGDLLGPVYNWFTEGFDTPVLKEAKALLDELAS